MKITCKPKEDYTSCLTLNQLFTISENHITDSSGAYETRSTNIKHNGISLHSYLSHANV